MRSILNYLCLRPTLSLQHQLTRAFGLTALLTFLILIASGCACIYMAGTKVIDDVTGVLYDQVVENLGITVLSTRNRFSISLDNIQTSLDILAEALLDRIVGYPDQGWEDDQRVPFFDIETKSNKYPIKSPLIPLEWNVSFTDPADAQEVMQERAEWLKKVPASTDMPSYFMQGMCDPNEKDPLAVSYFPNCTSANNDLNTGGVVQPTPMNKYLHEKVSDLSYLIKGVYEACPDILIMALYFHNGGAGAAVKYPALERSGNVPPYVSAGCDWMKAINKRSGKPYGTEEEIARCKPAGTPVPQREYNPNERSWFQEFALHPDDLGLYGPYVANGRGPALLTIGVPVFDRITNHFIGAVTGSLAIVDLNDALERNRPPYSSLWIVTFEDGTILADSEGAAASLGYVDVKITSLGNISDVTFSMLQNTVDFNEVWTSADIDKAFQDNIISCTAGVVAAQPLPAPPSEYDPLYRPRYLLISIVSDEVFSSVAEMKNEFESEALQVGLITASMGVFGMILVFAIVWCVSRMLTKPLLWIESVAWGIINHAETKSAVAFDTASENNAIASTTLRCTPKTEITELVESFAVMIQGFSHSGAPRVAGPAQHEIQNELTWRSDFKQLYVHNPEIPKKKFSSKTNETEPTDSDTSSSIQKEVNGSPPGSRRSRNRILVDTSEGFDESSSDFVVPAPPKKNLSNNIVVEAKPNSSSKRGTRLDKFKQVVHSALFWWILLLIVFPIFLTNIFICASVTKRIMRIVPDWANKARSSSIDLKMQTLNLSVATNAEMVAYSFAEATRDLYLLTMTGSSLLYNGIQRSSSFTELQEATEECKGYLDPSEFECPYNPKNFSCPCHNSSKDTFHCVAVNETSLRYRQQSFFAVQATDADLTTGNWSVAESFPARYNSANTTSWWSNISGVPGAEEGANASGYATLYDRLRVSSATSIISFPLYNYPKVARRPRQTFGVFFSFEADGLFTGYGGCDFNFPYLAQWKVTEGNRPHLASPDLCPIGKYGYDPRCTDWYVLGKENYFSRNASLYVSAPYPDLDADQEYVSASVNLTSPLSNPSDGQYAGQASLAFRPTLIRRFMQRTSSPVFFIVTPEADKSGSNVLLSSKDVTTGKWEASSLGGAILEFDSPGSEVRKRFDSVALTMLQDGPVSGTVRFNRTNQLGQSEEIVLNYKPVVARVLQAVDPSDFRRGVNVSFQHAFTVAVGVTDASLKEPFSGVEQSVDNYLHRIQRIYIGTVIGISILIAFFCCFISVEVAKPVLTLLRIVKSIIAGDTKDDIISLKGGSREAYRVYNSFSKLYKVIRISNVAFYSGNLSWAYYFIDDAVKLFRKVGDNKAVGVACNNLGATLYAMSHTSKDRESITIENGSSVAEAAMKHFDESIANAQYAFDKAEGSDEKAAYAQSLADRLFNRSLLLLWLTCRQSDLEEQWRNKALDDLARARSLDEDVRDYWLEHKLLLKNSEVYFERLVRRIHGLVHFYELEYVRDVWDAKELLDDCDQFLYTAWNEPTAPLFKGLTPVGRLQQLESAAIRVEICHGRNIEAARLAMRMFAEDEFILESALGNAAKALLDLARSKDDDWSAKTRTSVKADLRRMLKFCKNVTLDIGKCMIFAIEVNEMLEGSPLLESVNRNCIRMYEECFAKDDYVGIVAYTTKGDLNVALGSKNRNEGRQLAMLDLATTATSDRMAPAFPYAYQMIVDCTATSENDSFIVLITDGFSWDPAVCKTVRAQIERLNKERMTSTHVIVVGLEIEEEEVIEEFKSMSKLSRLSMFVPITVDNVDRVFDSIGDTICGRGEPNSCMLGITMEKF